MAGIDADIEETFVNDEYLGQSLPSLRPGRHIPLRRQCGIAVLGADHSGNGLPHPKR